MASVGKMEDVPQVPNPHEQTRMESSSTWFYNLPPELLEKIFSFLTTNELLQAAEVCVEWKQVSRNKDLWKKMIFEQMTVPFWKINQLLCKNTSLEELRLCGRHDSDKILRLVAKKCRKLQNITLQMCNLQFDIMNRLQWCTQVRYLVVLDMFRGCRGSLIHTISEFYNLEVLKLTLFYECQHHEDVAVIPSRSFKKLRKLELDHNMLEPHDISLFLDRVKERLESLVIKPKEISSDVCYALGSCHKLVNLTINSCNIPGNTALLLEELVRLKNLTELRLSLYALPSTDSLATFLRNSPSAGQLQTLEVSFCKTLDDHCLKLIADSCPSLTYLEVRYCPNITDIGLQHVVRGCRNLRKLGMVSFKVMSKESYKLIREHLPALIFKHDGPSAPAADSDPLIPPRNVS